MKDQINTIRAGLAIAIDSEVFIDKPVRRALLDAVKAAAQIEAAVGEPVADINVRPTESGGVRASVFWHKLPVGSWLVYAAPVAQQYEAGDVASAASQGFRDGVASVTQQEPVAWAMPKGDGTFIDVITPAEHAREEGSYTVPLFAHPVAQQPQYEAGDMASAAAQGFRDGVASVAQQPSKATLEKLRAWEASGELIDRAWRVLQSQEKEIMRLEKMLAEERAQQPQAEAVPSDVDWPDVEDMAHSALQEALSFGLNHDVFHRFGKSVMQKTRAAIAQQKGQPCTPQQAEAVPLDNETKTMKLMGLVDDLIEADPDRAERFIETVLGRNALQKRLKQAQSKEPQAEAVPPGFEVWLRTVCFQRPTPEAYDLAKAAWRAAIAQQKGQP